MNRIVAVALGASAALFCAVARADVATADKLFAEGRALMGEGKFAAACAKFQASYDADPALGALMNHADCLERAGRLASAYGRWGDAVALAKNKGDERAEFAEERREKLKPQLSFVTLKVEGTLPPELVVFKGDTKLSAGAFGTALPTDPGETVVQVVRGDEVLWEAKLQLLEAQQRTLTVPIDEIVEQNPAPVKKRANIEIESGPGIAGTAPEGFWSTQRIAGFVLGGVGVVGAGVGFALGGIAMSKSSDLAQQCTDTEPRYCTAAGEETRASAFTFATASTWTLIGSGVVAAVGVTVIVTAPSDYAKLEERAFLAPWFGPDGGGLVAGARF